MDTKNRKTKSKQQSIDDGITSDSYEIKKKGKKGRLNDEPFVKVPSTFKNKRATDGGISPRHRHMRNHQVTTSQSQQQIVLMTSSDEGSSYQPVTKDKSRSSQSNRNIGNQQLKVGLGLIDKRNSDMKIVSDYTDESFNK